jgi:hypothetical protein
MGWRLIRPRQGLKLLVWRAIQATHASASLDMTDAWAYRLNKRLFGMR